MNLTLWPRAVAESLRIALISVPDRPLAAAGGADRAGQDGALAQFARALADGGHSVDVLIRRDAARLPAVVELQPNARLLRIEAGPAHPLPQEELLQHMPAFAEAARRILGRSAPYDLMHTDSHLSGWVGLALRQHFSLPLVATFHALGMLRGPAQPQRDAGRFALQRDDIERALVRHADRLIATRPEVEHVLLDLYHAAPDRLRRVEAEFTGPQVAARLAAVYQEVAGDLALPFINPAPRPQAGRAGAAGMRQ